METFGLYCKSNSDINLNRLYPTKRKFVYNQNYNSRLKKVHILKNTIKSKPLNLGIILIICDNYVGNIYKFLKYVQDKNILKFEQLTLYQYGFLIEKYYTDQQILKFLVELKHNDFYYIQFLPTAFIKFIYNFLLLDDLDFKLRQMIGDIYEMDCLDYSYEYINTLGTDVNFTPEYYGPKEPLYYSYINHFIKETPDFEYFDVINLPSCLKPSNITTDGPVGICGPTGPQDGSTDRKTIYDYMESADIDEVGCKLVDSMSPKLLNFGEIDPIFWINGQYVKFNIWQLIKDIPKLYNICIHVKLSAYIKK